MRAGRRIFNSSYPFRHGKEIIRQDPVRYPARTGLPDAAQRSSDTSGHENTGRREASRFSGRREHSQRRTGRNSHPARRRQIQVKSFDTALISSDIDHSGPTAACSVVRHG